MSPRLECVALRLTTRQGVQVAVGGLCLPGHGERWQQRFEALRQLPLTDGDLFTVDERLAQALEQLADETLVVAGATAAAPIPLGMDESTGGVLGSPHETVESAQSQCERLAEGLWLYTAPGGPGLAAVADEQTVLAAGQALGTAWKKQKDINPLELLRQRGMDTALVVTDGTGPRAWGLLAAMSQGREYLLYLDR